ncbi:hypothetical protein B0H17DRAFT_1137890 [Mycena rosella]|uniref:Uncharacterized protein n=1 Tax=Mycena rosella TaxID=1033263 RepID=A0AAD7D7M1_MYCRO|nr:hypothetical protein B0H17DRAFT_1137890 [Mycena rosella]
MFGRKNPMECRGALMRSVVTHARGRMIQKKANSFPPLENVLDSPAELHVSRTSSTQDAVFASRSATSSLGANPDCGFESLRRTIKVLAIHLCDWWEKMAAGWMSSPHFGLHAITHALMKCTWIGAQLVHENLVIQLSHIFACGRSFSRTIPLRLKPLDTARRWRSRCWCACVSSTPATLEAAVSVNSSSERSLEICYGDGWPVGLDPLAIPFCSQGAKLVGEVGRAPARGTSDYTASSHSTSGLGYDALLCILTPMRSQARIDSC